MLSVAALAAAPPARAQTAATGALTGTLLSARNTPIPSAAIEVCPVTTGATAPCLTTTSAANGRFDLTALSPGTWRLRTPLAAEAQLEITPGEVTETVLRPSTKPILPASRQPEEDAPTDSATNSATNPDANPDASPDANPDADRAEEEEARQSPHIYSPDSRSQGLRRTATPRLAFSAGATTRFDVEETIPSAASGSGTGSLFVVTTPRGGPAFHGGAALQLGGSALSATQPYSPVQRFQNNSASTTIQKPAAIRLAAGLHVGGPLSHRRSLTGFVGAEAALHARTVISSPRDPGFYTLTPTQSALLANRGVTPSAINSALTYIDNLSGPVARTSTAARLFLRADYAPRHDDSLALTVSFTNATGPAGRAASSSIVPLGRASLGTERNTAISLLADWTHRFSPRFTQTLRAEVFRVRLSEAPDTPLPAEPSISPGGLAPEVRIASQFEYGTPSALGRSSFPDERRLQVAASTILAAHAHLITLGVDFAAISETITATQNRAGTFAYDSAVTGGHAGGLVDWITDATFNVNTLPNGGCPAIFAPIHDFCFRSFTQSFGESSVQFPLHEISAFAEDHWHPADSFTIDAGLRYDYTLLPVPQNPNPALDAVFGAQGATAIFPEDRNNFGPRLALAWSPAAGRRGTLHIGAGEFYARVPGSTLRSALTNTALPTSVTRIRITPSTITACPQVPMQGFGYPCAFTAAPPGVVLQTTSALLLSRRFRSPAILRADLGWEKSFGSITTLVAYSGALAVQLPNTRDINLAPATTQSRFQLQGGSSTQPGVRNGDSFILPIYTARIAPAFGPVTLLASNANATFHALHMRAEHHGSGSLAWRAAYTWSKTLDYGPDSGIQPRSNGQLDPYTLGYDKGRSNADVPHAFSGDVFWRVHFAHAGNLATRAASGLRFDLAATAGSGRPYSCNIFGGRSLPGGAVSINAAGGSVFLPTVGRNTLRLPPRWSTDLHLARAFPVHHHLRGDAAVTIFNLANHFNPTQINARAFLAAAAINGTTPLIFQDAATVAAEGLPAASTFGTLTQSDSATDRERRAQLSLHLTW